MSVRAAGDLFEAAHDLVPIGRIELDQAARRPVFSAATSVASKLAPANSSPFDAL
jgi:hypothetical protein